MSPEERATRAVEAWSNTVSLQDAIIREIREAITEAREAIAVIADEREAMANADMKRHDDASPRTVDNDIFGAYHQGYASAARYLASRARNAPPEASHRETSPRPEKQAGRREGKEMSEFNPHEIAQDILNEVGVGALHPLELRERIKSALHKHVAEAYEVCAVRCERTAELRYDDATIGDARWRDRAKACGNELRMMATSIRCAPGTPELKPVKAPDPGEWAIRPGTFDVRASCPRHPDAPMRQHDSGSAICSADGCRQLIGLCNDGLGLKECVLEIYHAGAHVSPCGSSWPNDSDEALPSPAPPPEDKPLATPTKTDAGIPMLLWCPECGSRHIDVGEWAERSHHTHACQHCGNVWRPAVVNTSGVRFLPGFKNDTDPEIKEIRDALNGRLTTIKP
jgi:hypothetical protein